MNEENYDDFGGPEPLDMNNPEEADIHESYSATMENEDPIGPKKKFQHQRPHGQTVEQIDRNQRNQAVWVAYCSPEYKKFISNMSTPEMKLSTHVCLTCWQFVTAYQKKHHEGFGHQCTSGTKLQTEKAFLHFVKLFDRHAPQYNKVQLFGSLTTKQNASQLSTFHLPQSQVGENKVRKENSGKTKGCPPFLGKPQVPFSILPQKMNAASMIEGVSLEQKAMKERLFQMPLEEQSRLENEGKDQYLSALDIVVDLMREMQRNVEFVQRQMDHISRRVDDLNATESKEDRSVVREDKFQFK